jgi:CRP-like cAMP-binding protein
VLRLSVSLMRRVLEEYPQVAAAMYTTIAEELGDLNAELERVGRRFA